MVQFTAKHIGVILRHRDYTKIWSCQIVIDTLQPPIHHSSFSILYSLSIQVQLEQKKNTGYRKHQNKDTKLMMGWTHNHLHNANKSCIVEDSF